MSRVEVDKLEKDEIIWNITDKTVYTTKAMCGRKEGLFKVSAIDDISHTLLWAYTIINGFTFRVSEKIPGSLRGMTDFELRKPWEKMINAILVSKEITQKIDELDLLTDKGE